jgi:three-Cys-motif partner protein
MTKEPRYDEIGYWSEIKLDIVREYWEAYSRIMSAQKSPSFYHVYIDAFAGAGLHISRTTGDFVPGSPLSALMIQPPFKEYHFIDLDSTKVESLERISRNRQDVHVYHGDSNDILLKQIFPLVSYADYRRGLCFLDPYGLHLKWEVILGAAAAKSLEIFLNFPVADMNRNVLWRNPEGVDERQLERMNAFWGDETWKDAAYSIQQRDLFRDMPAKTTNKEIAEAFKSRLLEVAGFKFVPEPLPMVNSQNAVIYYLFFASHNKTGGKIVSEIFKKHSTRVISHVF